MSPLALLGDDTLVDFDTFAEKPKDLAPRRDYKVAGEVTAAFHKSRALIRLLRGPIGCGKTYAAFREIFARAVNMPVCSDGVMRTRAVVCRRTYRQLKASTVESFWAALPPRWAMAGEFNKADMTFSLRTKIKRDGREVEMLLEVLFVAMDRDRALEQFKGMEYNILYLNEAVHINALALQMGLSRLGRYPPAEKMADARARQFYVILDSNSFDPAHPFYPFFYDDAVIAENARTAKMAVREYLQVFDYPSGLSPDAENLANLDADYYAKQSAGQTQQYIDVMIKNKFGSVADGRPCYGAFRADIHASEYIAPDKNLPIFCGLDFGRDPAVVICQEDADGNVSVIDADFRLKTEGATGVREMFGVFAARYSPNDGWNWLQGGCDPGGAAMTQVVDISPMQMAAYYADQLGVCRTAPAITNNVGDRIEVVNSLFSQVGSKRIPALRISYDRTNKGLLWLIRCCSKYQFATVKGAATVEDRHHDKPQKDDYSHTAEALQYALLRPAGGAREKLRYHPATKKTPAKINLQMSPFAR